MSAMGIVVGFLSSLAVGCESERDNSSEDCNCHPASVGTTTLGEPTSDEGDFPSLEGAWLNVESVKVAAYDTEAPAAVLEYFDSGQLVRVKFAAVAFDGEGASGGAGGEAPTP